MTREPFFSVVTPVLDGGAVFVICLEALERSSFRDFEHLVVDDGSTDDSVARARSHGARVLSTTGRRGPAAARNLGAREARGRYLLFVDADCEVHPDTLDRAAEIFTADPELGALFGCYDDRPAAGGLVSQFKNLMHRFVHLDGVGEASTFWAGCGAVRRDLFLAAGGFDEKRFARPSIEDIELGYRLRDRGVRIRLTPEVEVRHHKRWTLGGLLRTDVRDRGIPWTELLLERGRRGRELNLGAATRASVALVWLAGLSVLASPVSPPLLAAAAAALLLAVVLNLGTYRRFRRARGALFALRAIPLHLLYFGYSGLAYLLGCARYARQKLAGGGR